MWTTKMMKTEKTDVVSCLFKCNSRTSNSYYDDQRGGRICHNPGSGSCHPELRDSLSSLRPNA